MLGLGRLRRNAVDVREGHSDGLDVVTLFLPLRAYRHSGLCGDEAAWHPGWGSRSSTAPRSPARPSHPRAARGQRLLDMLEPRGRFR
eukprot:3850705-Pyramimonas_sp.AAC.1